VNAPDRIWAWTGRDFARRWHSAPTSRDCTTYLRADGPTITAYREALRTMGRDPDSIAREAEKEAQ